jgi:uncharacterized membrane protein YqhA
MFHKILTSSRYIVLIAVIGSFLASIVSLLAGGARTILIIAGVFEKIDSSEGMKGIAFSFVEVVDLFLIGTVFYIIALGLYELFVDDRLDLPNWLVVHSLDDLKARLINGVIVIMGVYFLGALVNWDGQSDLLRLSLAVALVIAALTLFQYTNARNHSS